MGIGAMTDFGPLLANPMSLLLGAADVYKRQMYTGRLAKDQKAGKDLQPTIDKMNALIDDYDVKSKPLFCAQAGLVDEIVDMPMMRNYIVAFTDAVYQNPESICPFHQMLLPRTIRDYDNLKK